MSVAKRAVATLAHVLVTATLLLSLCLMRDDRGNIVSPLAGSEWIGEWQDNAGNVVTYSLMEYGYRDVTKNHVHTYARYVTAGEVARAPRSLKP